MSAGSEKSAVQLLSIEELLAFQKDTQDRCAASGSVKMWGNHLLQPIHVTAREDIFVEDFRNLDNWHHEGIGALSQPEAQVLQISCVGSAQGEIGSMAFCKQDFPDRILIEYDLRVLETNGLVINFIAGQGRQGEDMLDGVPRRQGTFADYVYSAKIRSYHVSISRYDDTGKHTGVSNWRRNPGLFLMAQQPDLCSAPQVWHRIRILKLNNRLQLWVGKNMAGGFEDRNEIPEPLPRSGKFGFRVIGSKAIVQVKNFKVSQIVQQPLPEQK